MTAKLSPSLDEKGIRPRMHRPGSPGWTWLRGMGLAGLLVAAGTTGGCVRRTVTIKTVPEGARVTLNDDEVGTSPVTVPFTWYGDLDVILHLEGYKTLHTHHKVVRPWYQYPPVDLIAEAFVPFTIRDKHEATFELEPARPIERDKLLEQARDLRDRALYTEE